MIYFVIYLIGVLLTFLLILKIMRLDNIKPCEICWEEWTDIMGISLTSYIGFTVTLLYYYRKDIRNFLLKERKL